MRKKRLPVFLLCLLLTIPGAPLWAKPSSFSFNSGMVYTGAVLLVMLLLLLLVLALKFNVSALRTTYKKQQHNDQKEELRRHITQLSSKQIEKVKQGRHRSNMDGSYRILPLIIFTALSLLCAVPDVQAQSPVTPTGESLFQQGGIIITLILILIPILVALILLVVRTRHAVRRQRNMLKTRKPVSWQHISTNCPIRR